MNKLKELKGLPLERVGGEVNMVMDSETRFEPVKCGVLGIQLPEILKSPLLRKYNAS